LEEYGKGYILKSKAKNPFPSGYRLELDVTEELDEKLGSQYMQIIGILRWAVELGQIDIFLEVSLLLQYEANPRLGLSEITLSRLDTQWRFTDSTPVEGRCVFARAGILIKELCMS
jgi:hypothetical protein